MTVSISLYLIVEKGALNLSTMIKIYENPSPGTEPLSGNNYFLCPQLGCHVS